MIWSYSLLLSAAFGRQKDNERQKVPDRSRDMSLPIFVIMPDLIIRKSGKIVMNAGPLESRPYVVQPRTDSGKRRWRILQKLDFGNAFPEGPSKGEILQFLDI